MIDPGDKAAQTHAWGALTDRIATGNMSLGEIENYAFPEERWIKPTDPEELKKLEGLLPHQ
jgi:hypothetical protein